MTNRKLLIKLLFCGVVLLAGAAVVLLAFDRPGEAIQKYWIITPLAVLAAGVANATAVGGGFLFVPLFIFGYGLPPLAATKLSLATQAFGMTSGALGWSRTYIVGNALLWSCIASFAGMFVGTYGWVVDGSHVKLMFGWVSLAIGIAVLAEMKFGSRFEATSVQGDNWIKRVVFLVLCFAGGLVNAWVSIGIGEVVALYLMFVYRVRIESAIATGVAALAAVSILGFVLHAGLGGIPWHYLAFTAPGVVIGGRYGARIGRWVEARIKHRSQPASMLFQMNHSPLKWVFVAVVMVDGLVMLYQGHRF